MKKFARIILLFFALLLLIVGGLTVFILTIDPNDYRENIASLAAEQGIQLEIRGDLKWKLYPELLLEVNQAEIQTSSAGNKIEAQLEQLGLALKLLPLFRKQLEFRGLNINGADIIVRQGLDSASDSLATEQAVDETSVELPAIYLEQLQITDSRFAFFSAESEPLVFTDIELSAQQVNSSGDYFPLQFGFDLGPGVPLSFSEPLQADMQIAITPGNLAISLDSLSLSLQQLQTSIALQASGDFSLNLVDGELSATNASLALADAELEWSLLGQLEPLALAGSARTNKFNLADLLGDIGIDSQLADGAFETAQLNLNIDIQGKLIQLNKLQLELDDSRLSGELSANLADVPQFRFVGELDRINLDNYMAQSAETENDEASEPGASLPAHQGQFELSIGELVVKEVAITEVSTRIASTARQITVQELSGNIAEGDFALTANLGLTGQASRHQFDMQARQIFIGQVISSISGEAAPLTGQLSAQFSGVSTGELASLLGNMSGSGSVNATNLELIGVDVEGSICDISDRLQRQSLASNYDEFAESTSLEDMQALISLNSGQGQLTGLKAAIGNIQATGSGQINLQSMQYRAELRALVAGETTSENGCTVNRYLRNRVLPLTCSGTMGIGQPSCGIDQSFIQNAIQQTITQGLTNRLFGNDAADSEGEEQTDSDKPLEQRLLEGFFNRFGQ